MSTVLAVETRATYAIVDITDRVASAVDGVDSGLCSIFTEHTTVALILAPADDDMVLDIIALAKAWPTAHGPFRHHEEGNPNAEAHLVSAVAGTSLVLPIIGARLPLGRYQRILLLELDGPKQRFVHVTTHVAHEAST